MNQVKKPMMHKNLSRQDLDKLNKLRIELVTGLNSPAVKEFSEKSFLNEMHTKYKHLLLLKGK